MRKELRINRIDMRNNHTKSRNNSRRNVLISPFLGFMTYPHP